MKLEVEIRDGKCSVMESDGRENGWRGKSVDGLTPEQAVGIVDMANAMIQWGREKELDTAVETLEKCREILRKAGRKV